MNLRPDAAIGEDFEDQRMRKTSVDEVDFADAAAEGVEGAVHLRGKKIGTGYFLRFPIATEASLAWMGSKTLET